MKSDFRHFTIPNAPPTAFGDMENIDKANQLYNEQQRQLKKETEQYKNRLRFLDVNFNMNQVENTDSIKQSIRNILLTEQRERIFLPGFGSNIKGSLFKNWSTELGNQIANQVVALINRWEPRVAVYNNKVSLTFYPEQHVISITVPYLEIESGFPGEFTTIMGA